MSMDDRIVRDQRVTLVGGGLTGSLLAVYLARRGFEVDVYERGPDPAERDIFGGRSINLALAERGIHALAGVGLHQRVARFALPMRGRMIHDPAGSTQLQPYGQREHEVIYSVHRAMLNQALIEAARETRRVNVRFHQELAGVDLDTGTATFVDQRSDLRTERPAWPLIGADGAGSRVRTIIEEGRGFTTRSELLDHGYRELTIPPGPGGAFRLDPQALHIWPRGELMMIALPNTDGSFTATLFMPQSGPASFAALDTFARFEHFMGETFPDALPHLTRLDRDYAEHPIGILGTVRCPHWHLDGRALLIGDAAHAIVPFHGQGMNCGFEDCEALARILARSRRWSDAFAALQSERQPNADAIADMALENYVEMRASVIDDDYLLRRALALELERRHPDRFVPRYSMVMFRRIGYAEAQRRGAVNAAILTELTREAETLGEIDFDRAAALIAERLAPLPDEQPTLEAPGPLAAPSPPP